MRTISQRTTFEPLIAAAIMQVYYYSASPRHHPYIKGRWLLLYSGCGGRTRTSDLLVMSQASCLCSTPQYSLFSAAHTEESNFNLARRQDHRKQESNLKRDHLCACENRVLIFTSTSSRRSRTLSSAYFLFSSFIIDFCLKGGFQLRKHCV